MSGLKKIPVFLLILLSLALPALTGFGCEEGDRPPKLVIMIVLDGFRADYADRFLDVLDEGGLKFLYKSGTVFTNARIDYFFSATAPGHAAIATGCYPSRNGIAANSWWDSETGKKTKCALDASPAQLRGPHITEGFRSAYGPGARIFSVSVKKRSAIMLGGRDADGVFWLSEAASGFTTSSWYADQLPEWVVNFNSESALPGYRGRRWDLLLPPRGQEKCRDDYSEYETAYHSLGVVFPHLIEDHPDQTDSSLVHTLRHTPLMDEVVGDFTDRLIREEGLGTDSTPDLLLVSFSSIDEIGHDFGPFSLEIGDAVWRIDRVLSRLLGSVSDRLDLEHECLIALTSDHGMTPLPGLAAASGKEAGLVVSGPVEGRDEWPNVKSVIDDALDSAYGPAEWVVSVPYPSVKLDIEAMTAKGLDPGMVLETARSALAGLRGVESVVTARELASGENPGVDVWLALTRWYVPDRCGDLVVSLKPHYTWSSPRYATKGGTNHGSIYDDDSKVPLVFFGKGVPVSTRDEPVSHVHIAPSLLKQAGVESSITYDGTPLF